MATAGSIITDELSTETLVGVLLISSSVLSSLLGVFSTFFFVFFARLSPVDVLAFLVVLVVFVVADEVGAFLVLLVFLVCVLPTVVGAVDRVLGFLASSLLVVRVVEIGLVVVDFEAGGFVTIVVLLAVLLLTDDVDGVLLGGTLVVVFLVALSTGLVVGFVVVDFPTEDVDDGFPVVFWTFEEEDPVGF